MSKVSKVSKSKVQKKLEFVITTPAKAREARDRVVTPSSVLSKQKRDELKKKKDLKVYAPGLAKKKIK